MSDRKNSLEIYVADLLTDIYKYCRPTIASGATPVEKGDIKNPWFNIECVLGNSRVLTPSGNVPIKDININDEIINYFGKTARVKNKFERIHSGKIYNINISGAYKDLEITGEHPVLFRKNYNEKPYWITVKELFKLLPGIHSTKGKNGYLLMPKIHSDTRLFKNKILLKEPKIVWDLRLMRIFGWYLSEGFCNKKYPYIQFTLGKHEKEYADELVDLISSTGYGDVKLQDGTTTLVVFWKCKEFHKIIMDIFGTGAYKKKIPLWFNNLSDNMLKELIKYMVRGDGHRDAHTVHYSSYSTELLHSVKNILITLKYSFNISGSNGKENQIRILGTNEDLLEICDKKPTKEIKKEKNIQKRRMFYTSDGCWCRIREIKKTNTKCTVYNIETESEDYICESVLVHNCKQKRTSKAFTIPYAEWYKNCGEADKQYKDPVFVVENELGEKIAAMRLEEWHNLICELMDLRKILEEQND